MVRTVFSNQNYRFFMFCLCGYGFAREESLMFICLDGDGKAFGRVCG